MALTPQDVADAVNAAGIDKPTLAAMLAGMTGLYTRNVVMAQIQSEQAKAAADQQAHQATIADLQLQLQKIDDQFRKLIAGS